MNLANLIKLTEVPRLVEKYSGIGALPLALPKFELDDVDTFWRIWNEEHARVDRQHIDRGAVGKDPTKVSKSYTQWDGVALYEDEALLKSAAWVTKLSPALAESQPNYVKSIFERLPFVRIRSIRLWSANCTIPPHYDGNMPASLDGVLRFPTEIRIMLDDKNPTETFWLTPIAVSKPHCDVPQVDRHYVKLPIDTNTFAWNNEDFLHGADYDPRYRKILVVIKGWVDIERLEPLLDESLNKYPGYVIKG
jgi:hypothetical protein